MMKSLSTTLSMMILLASPLAAQAQAPQVPELPAPPPPSEGSGRPPLPPPGAPGDQRERGPRGPEGREGRAPDDRPDRPRAQPRDGERRPDGPRPRENAVDPHFDRDHRFGMDPKFDRDPHFEAGRRDREPSQAARPTRLTPYIGVITSSASPVLSSQLGLGEGFGLVVDEVVPESPAKTAGIERYDVLKQLNEQQLVDPAQLATLVRSLGKDKEVTIAIIRKGQEQKLTLKIGEKMLPEREQPDRRDGLEIPRRRMNEGGRPPQPGDPAGHGSRSENESPGGVKPADLLREMRPGAPGLERGDRIDGKSRWDASRARVTMRDHDGEVEVVVRDGHRTLTARGASGDTVFTGPVDTDEQRKAVPAPYREKLTALELPDAIPAPPREQRRGERPAPPTPADRPPEVQ